MTLKRTWTFALLAAALAVTVASSSLVHGKGKPPKDPPPEPDPPPVTYELTWIALESQGISDVARTGKDINNNGDVVCNVRFNAGDDTTPVVYFASDGVLRRLSDFIDPDDLFDPDLGPLTLYYVSAINDLGQIAGRVVDLNGIELLYRFTPPEPGEDFGIFELLGIPDPSDLSFRASGINIYGDICGSADDSSDVSHAYYYSDADGFVEINAGADSQARDINDAGQVVGYTSSDNTAFRYSPLSGLEIFTAPNGSEYSTAAYSINNSGDFVGTTTFTNPPKGKNSTKFKPYLYSNALDDFVDLGADYGEYGRGINDAGDVVGGQNSNVGFPFVHLGETQEFFRLDDQVLSSPEPMWGPGSNIRDFIINNSGQICLWVHNGSYTAPIYGICVLTPESP